MVETNTFLLMTQKIDFFVTYFTSEFTEIGIVSINSFLRFHPDTPGKVYCFDSKSKDLLNELINSSKVVVENIQDSNFIASFLKDLEKDRSLLEALISIKPLLLLQCFADYRIEDTLIYFDPDVMFYSRISLHTMMNSSFLVYEQKGVSTESKNNYGRFNAGIVLVKNSSQGKEILNLWHKYCLQWCRLEVEKDRYADQKYLDLLSLVPGFQSSCSWSSNLSARAFIKKGERISIRNTKDSVYVNGELLESFHFHGLRFSNKAILTGFNRFGKLQKRLRLFLVVYLPVIERLFETRKRSEVLNLNSRKESLVSIDKTMIYEKTKTSFPFNNIVNFYRMLRLSRIPSFPVNFFVRMRKRLWNQ